MELKFKIKVIQKYNNFIPLHNLPSEITKLETWTESKVEYFKSLSTDMYMARVCYFDSYTISFYLWSKSYWRLIARPSNFP